MAKDTAVGTAESASTTVIDIATFASISGHGSGHAGMGAFVRGQAPETKRTFTEWQDAFKAFMAAPAETPAGR